VLLKDHQKFVEVWRLHELGNYTLKKLEHCGVKSEEERKELLEEWKRVGELIKEVFYSLPEKIMNNDDELSSLSSSSSLSYPDFKIILLNQKKALQQYQQMLVFSTSNNGKVVGTTTTITNNHFSSASILDKATPSITTKWFVDLNDKCLFHERNGKNEKRWFPQLSAFRTTRKYWYGTRYEWSCCGAQTKHHLSFHDVGSKKKD